MRPRPQVLLLGALLWAQSGLQPSPAPCAATAAVQDPWGRLAHLRHELAAQHLAAGFAQSFRPAGFAQAEKESGDLYLALPDCLRWEYRVPEAKSFLICGPDLYAWIQGDPSGRHTVIEPRGEPGLDLLLLSIDELRRRYDVAATGDALELRPREAQNAIRRASFVLAAGGSRLSALEYEDIEGNLTRFDLTAWKPLTDRTFFDPPPIQWNSE